MARKRKSRQQSRLIRERIIRIATVNYDGDDLLVALSESGRVYALDPGNLPEELGDTWARLPDVVIPSEEDDDLRSRRHGLRMVEGLPYVDEGEDDDE